jgi:hypothetical protein
VEQPRGQPALHDEATELRACGERFIEVQRVVVAGDFGEQTNVVGRERQTA